MIGDLIDLITEFLFRGIAFLGCLLAFIFLIFVIFYMPFMETDHDKVMNAYESGNIHAKELLENGFNKQNSEKLSTKLIDSALSGDEEAKKILHCQIQTLVIEKNQTSFIPAPIIIRY